MLGGKKGCLFGLLLGSVLKIVVGLSKGFIYALAWAVVYLGLWAPLLYAVLGVILFFTVNFNPFEWTTLGQLYFAGFIATAVVALIITIRNLVLKPLKAVSDGYKNPIWKKNKDGQTLTPKERELAMQREAALAGYPLRNDEYGEETPFQKPRLRSFAGRSEPQRENPTVYESSLERGSIVHEFSDRFEVYVLKNGKMVLDKVEMKNEELQ